MNERTPPDPRDEELRNLVRRLAQAQQQNNDTINGNMNRISRGYNKLARDVAAMADYLGVKIGANDEPVEITGGSTVQGHDDLEGVSANDHHNQIHSIGGTDHTGQLPFPVIFPTDGEDGAAGAPGLRGEDGAAGATGPQGDPGNDGAPGADGERGFTVPWPGEDGEPNLFFLPGPPGADGAEGGTSQGTRTLWIPASEFVVDDASTGTVGTTPDLVATRVFADGNREGVHFAFAVPREWDFDSSWSVIMLYGKQTTAAGDIRWAMTAAEVTESMDPATAGTTVSATSTPGASTDVKTESFSGFPNLTANTAFVKLNIERVGANAADTYTANARLYGVFIVYTADLTGAQGEQGEPGAAGTSNPPGLWLPDADEWGMWIPPDATGLSSDDTDADATVFGGAWSRAWKGKAVSWWTDFMQPNTAPYDGWLEESTNTQVLGLAGTAANPGQLQLTTLNASNTSAWLSTNGGSVSFNPILFGGGEWYCFAVVKIDTLSASAERFVARTGFIEGASVAASTSTNSVYFQYVDNVNGGNWQAICASDAGGGSGGATAQDTTVAGDTNWHKFQIIVNAAGTEARFYIDEVLRNTITSDIPIATGEETAFVPFNLRKTVGTTARTGRIDMAGLAFKPTVQR